MKCFIFLLLGCWLCDPAAAVAASAPQSAALPDLVLASTRETMQTPDGAWLVLIYTDAFKRLGYHLVVAEYPLARGAALAKQGAIDGLLQRAAFYHDIDPSLVQVTESHFTTRFVAYGIKPITGLNGWSSLRDRALHVECRRGILVCEVQAPKYLGDDHVAIANSTELGLRMLVHGRADLLIDSKYSVDGWLTNPEFRAVRALGVMDEQTMHVFLHAKHTALAPRLADVLRQMKQDGVVEQYRVKAAAGAP